MTIHSEHPFWHADDERDPLRRLRGRMAAPVTVLTAGSGRGRVGHTVSSVLLAEGEPAQVLALLDEESEVWAAEPERIVVNVLGPTHAWLAEVFAGTAPAPGGPFTQGEWTDSRWGPVLADAAGWIGIRVVDAAPARAGWFPVLAGDVEHVHVGGGDALAHVRGRFQH
ncbi:flavin reductase family protein [Aeromicrobium halocynthiae]|uniref:flavin reductase family protein n=1 Tax=Aeromicrobium halocynthiae TaxID=560557 RepID=UPI0031DF0058